MTTMPAQPTHEELTEFLRSLPVEVLFIDKHQEGLRGVRGTVTAGEIYDALHLHLEESWELDAEEGSQHTRWWLGPLLVLDWAFGFGWAYGTRWAKTKVRANPAHLAAAILAELRCGRWDIDEIAYVISDGNPHAYAQGLATEMPMVIKIVELHRPFDDFKPIRS